MVRRDEIEWVRDSLAAGAKILAGRAEPNARLAHTRARVIWPTREYIDQGATAALVVVKDTLQQLEDEPPVTPTDSSRSGRRLPA